MYYIAAVLITGGKPDTPYPYSTAELYLPSTGVSCTLPSIPGYPEGGYNWWDHTVTRGGLICGGQWYDRSCLLWSPDTGIWEDPGAPAWGDWNTLDIPRYEHVSWTPSSGNGTYLMGGFLPGGNPTTTLITSDGSQKQGFNLQYEAM